MGSFSLVHWLIVILVIMLLFGRGRISDLMGDMAKGINSFKKGLADDGTPAPPAGYVRRRPIPRPPRATRRSRTRRRTSPRPRRSRARPATRSRTAKDRRCSASIHPSSC